MRRGSARKDEKKFRQFYRTGDEIVVEAARVGYRMGVRAAAQYAGIYLPTNERAYLEDKILAKFNLIGNDQIRPKD